MFLVHGEGYRPQWYRTAGIAQDGTLYLPAMMAVDYKLHPRKHGPKQEDAELKAILAASAARVWIVRFNRHYYLPATHILHLRPEMAEHVEQIAQAVNEAMRARTVAPIVELA